MSKITIVRPAVITENGEIVREEKSYTIETRIECPFRSITDLKGYDDAECSNQASIVDTSGFVSPRVMIKRILDHSNAFDLERYAANLPAGEYDSDYGLTEDYEGEDIDNLDVVESFDSVAETQDLFDEVARERSSDGERDGEATKGATTSKEPEDLNESA